MSSGNPLDVALSALEAQAGDGNGKTPSRELERLVDVERDCELCKAQVESSLASIGRQVGVVHERVEVVLALLAEHERKTMAYLDALREDVGRLLRARGR